MKHEFNKPYKIISIDGSRLIENNRTIQIRKDKKIDYTQFEGYLDYSLETIKLKEVYKKHKKMNELEEDFSFFSPEKDNEKKHIQGYSLALINVSFNYAIKEYRKRQSRQGYVYVLEGYGGYNESKLNDHILCDIDEDGMEKIVAIEIPYSSSQKSLEKYGEVKEQADLSSVDIFFEYDENKKCYKKTDREFKSEKTIKDIRKELYKNGFECDGKHYVRYKRSAGSSREGHCLFIPEILYKDMMAWSLCGLKESQITDLASFQAYNALTLSSIENTIELSKKSILIIKDQESIFDDYSIIVQDKNKDDLIVDKNMCKIKNKIWDGEALLDEEVFKQSGYEKKGMMLLRNRFFKTCAFNTKLQQWFSDNDITDIEQLNGYYRRGAKLSDIKLVITESSLKYCKFLNKGSLNKNVFNQWIDNVFDEGNKCEFGVVKTEKEPFYMNGKMVSTNYQLLNTLELRTKEVKEFLDDSISYLNNIIDIHDPKYMRYHLGLSTQQNYYEILLEGNGIKDNKSVDINGYRIKTIFELLKHSNSFTMTKYYRDFRSDIKVSMKNQLKKGKVLVNGTYATLFGNGAEFLQAIIDKNYKVNDPIALKDNQIRTTKFGYNKELLCARSPHITMGNLFVANNIDNDIYKRYFNFEDAHEIVCINAIKHNIQQRLNGCDYDSDTMLITDNKILLDATRRNDKEFPVPVSQIKPTSEKKYDINNPDNIAELDIAIAQNKIGEIVNLSQLLNSLCWDYVSKYGIESNKVNEIYKDICKLAVLSGLEIDKAKRFFEISTFSIIKSLRNKYGEQFKTKDLEFYDYMIDKNEKRSSKEEKLKTTMQFIFDEVNLVKETSGKGEKRKDLIELVDLDEKDKNNNADYHRKENIINKIKKINNDINNIFIKMRANTMIDKKHCKDMIDDLFYEATEYVEKNLKTDFVLRELLKELDKDNGNKKTGYYAFLFSAIAMSQKFQEKMKKEENIESLEYAENIKNPIYIYGHPHQVIKL